MPKLFSRAAHKTNKDKYNRRVPIHKQMIRTYMNHFFLALVYEQTILIKLVWLWEVTESTFDSLNKLKVTLEILYV